MAEPLFVPATLLDPLDRKIAGPELERRVVTAYVLGGGGRPKQWATAITLRAAAALWPEFMVGKPARNVLTVLLELEQLGVVAELEPVVGGYLVSGRQEAAAE